MKRKEKKVHKNNKILEFVIINIFTQQERHVSIMLTVQYLLIIQVIAAVILKSII